MVAPLSEIKQLADMVADEWGEVEAASVVHEWVEAQKGGHKNGN